MKKNTLSFVLVASALVGTMFVAPSCNKGKTNTTEKTQELITGNLSFEIPIHPSNGESDSLTSFFYKVNMDSLVKSYDAKYDTSSIRSVQLRSCVLTFPDNTTTDNFRNFHTTIIGVTSGTNKYLTRIAAKVDIVDTAAYVLNLNKEYEPNLASYFKADSVCYRLFGNFRRGTTMPLNCNATITYDMVLSK